MNPVKQAILDLIAAEFSISAADFNFAVLTVKSVDVDNRVCVASDSNNHDFANLRLQFIGGSSFLIPVVGSAVIALISHSFSLGYIISTSKIKQAEVVIGDTSAVIDTDGCHIKTANMSADINDDDIIFNGGKLNGLVKIDDLTKRLNIIEKDINRLKVLFSAGVCTPQDGGKAFIGSCSSWAAETLTETVRSDYENEKIKQ